MPGNGPDTGDRSRTCLRCGAALPSGQGACHACGFSLPSVPPPMGGGRRDPARRLWIALAVAVVTLLLSFCLLYVILQAFRR